MKVRARLVTLLVLVTVFGCGLLKKKDAGSDGGASATAASDGGGAMAAGDAAAAPGVPTNENEVARFPDETKIDGTAATVQWGSVVAHTAPPSGPAVATLKKGTAVVELGQHEKYILCSFDSPKDATVRLMGWVYADAFNAIAYDGGAMLTCGKQTLVHTDVDLCATVCTKDADCTAGFACNGTAQHVVKGKPAETVSVCNVGVRPNTPTTTVDAGPGPANAGPEIPHAAGAACPSNYVGLNDGRCHMICTGKPTACGSARCKDPGKCGAGTPSLCVSSATLCKP